MWSAAVDPRVIVARATPAQNSGGRTFDAAIAATRILRGRHHEHLLINQHGVITRLDIIEGTVLAGPVSLRFELADDCHLEVGMGAIRAFASENETHPRHTQLARRLLALHAADARAAGTSLRETAERVLGPGDWPGDGEHRKSVVRRLVAAGEQMVRAGPRAILESRRTERKFI
jgi:hypothetical protein